MKSRIISIIIPTYNRGDLLVRAVQSVIDLETEVWELIIVDDGSFDDTKIKLLPFLTDRRIRYFYQKNKGVSAARNKGVEIANGEYLIFLDSDDTLHKDLLSFLIKAEFYRYDIICWQVIKFIDGKKSIWRPVKLGKIYNGIIASFLAGSICYKKQVFLNVGGYDESMKFGENYELGMRVSNKKDLKVKIINKSLLFNYVNTTHRTSNSLENRIHSYFHMYEKHRKRYLKDRKSNFEINYLIAYVLEKSGKPVAALKFYKKSWLIAPWKTKPLLKFFYFSLFS
ncbi:glycosyltransferase family 2 protein [Salinimicrobium tongyeongense]|uniref:Glycosyltransferase family 2 protein n=1 Tax=Salinimicrobium tongyeongense TaxID=2809707 RepID=A0ABY6NRF9_9FLAO|nr:glycosyltransferase family A protein [Salinimicrobium tongyeongense]UZH55505.1 glycosyltransferase family 2 protein [Salinimicrobium tongyeongense]